ncbi:uncharacterized protein L199_007765 [Kwoniella botswanensis]|uniref:uncharacterized protein n=1 Tax=Kwoniella botswanensis TaxID=1268659 RepID=UPI00315CD603
MDDSLIPSLKKTAHRVVRNAARPGGTLEQGVFTMFMARSEIERTMGLDQGELGKGRWKSMVKELVKAAVDDIDNIPSSSRASSSSYPSLSSSPSPLAQSTTTKSRSKSKASSSRSIKAKKSKRQESDEEDEYHSNSPKKIHKCGPKKRKSKGKKVDNESESEEKEEEEEVIENDDYDEGFPSSMPKSTPPKRPSNKNQQRKEEQEEEETETRKTYVEEPQARMSDSDMSSVYDEPPPSKSKARKSASASVSAVGKRKSVSKSVSVLSSDDEKPPKKSRGSNKNKKDPNEGLSPDEAKLADLKRIVVACGVRKQWAKEFADCPTTSSQIRHVQGLLSSLGMKGQPTLGKAKALKAKRELAQELDDVKTFEAARGLSSNTRERRSRASSGTKRKKVIGSDEEEEEEEEEDEPIELDKEESALGAVLDLDFLGGDSDSD